MNSIFGSKLFAYGLVGLLGMIIDFATTWICKEKFHLNKYFSNALGFTLAVLNNFLLNRYWTFQNFNHSFNEQILKFILVSLVGLGLNTFFLYLFLNYIRKNFYYLKLLVIGIVFFWNYFINYYFTFN